MLAELFIELHKRLLVDFGAPNKLYEKAEKVVCKWQKEVNIKKTFR